jgi:hypothetical protein
VLQIVNSAYVFCHRDLLVQVPRRGQAFAQAPAMTV